MNRILLLVCVLLGAILLGTAAVRAQDEVRFNRDVLPILSANCFACHGPDEGERQADLRLDIESDAKAPHLETTPLVPGQPDLSGIMVRITSTDPDLVMPPPSTQKSLKPEQIEVLRRWIAAGAEWQRHWSLESVVRPAGSLDDQVRRRLSNTGLALQPAATPHVLVRRLYLDLIGLPPSPEVADAFAANSTPEAYERLVDELLARPQFGEHWARMWLDLARYADTKGYEKDLGRTMWPYRDWVISALNQDMPLDQFTIEQLGGDLLPQPTQQQLIATAFHRNTMSNDEGGTDDEEFRVAAVKDRVDTTIQVWMGLTMGCAKCHSHKYDPISHSDYYRMFAIFNQTQDADQFDDAPRLELTFPDQLGLQEQLQAQISELEENLKRAEEAAGSADHQSEPATTEVQRLKDELTGTRQKLEGLKTTVVALPIMRELPSDARRETRIHNRGNFLDRGEPVEPGVLSALHALPADATADRLGLARWLVCRENSLTPRVWANRIWARLFGMGIVETEDDFGALGAPPTNPELLDWLAAEYRDGGWSLKKLLKTIVMSDTYRQASDVSSALREADPRNALQSRGARFRLTAEVIRDQALAVSGLLSLKMGGPAVMPPQPDGLWRSTYNGQRWLNAEGEDRFRRGLYTYLKRTTPYPAFNTFDGGSGEVCLIRRIRTNTPLQALVTLNDPVYVEAAAGLARRMVNVAGDAESRATRGLRLALIRPQRAGEAAPLVQLQQLAREEFEAAPEKASALIDSSRGQVGEMPPAEFAAWIVTASAILNLDEFLNRN